MQAAAVRALAPWLVGRDVDDLLSDLGGFGREITGDAQLRWLGPEKGVIHMACGALLNALWDLRAKREGLPLWQLLSRLSPEEICDLVDFRYLTDALTRDEALELLRAGVPGRAVREASLIEHGYPAYTTTPGWLGYDDEKLARLSREAVADGFDLIKLKVGASIDEDVRRMGVARDAVGPEISIAVDANQRWEVDEAVQWMTELAPFNPRWIEEPTSPDDILGHAEIRLESPPFPSRPASMSQRVMFKQFLRRRHRRGADRRKSSGGGQREYRDHPARREVRGARVSPRGRSRSVRGCPPPCDVRFRGGERHEEDRYIEYVDHLHEHFLDPVEIRRARYLAPTLPGTSAEMRPESIARFTFPSGPGWAAQ